MFVRSLWILLFLIISFRIIQAQTMKTDVILVPKIEGEWWPVAGVPDLGEKYNKPGQQPVDFGIWQAADGTWQIWSCIRNTKSEGRTRLFHRWEGAHLTDTNWKPMGIAMIADPGVGEEAGGLQAPFVLLDHDLYHLFYGDWNHICQATGKDGKTFTRLLNAQGKSGMFAESTDPGANTRDPMVLKIGDTFYCYYSAMPNQHGAVFCRTSKDLKTWGDSHQVAFGGSAGDGPYAAECPYVVAHDGWYYLFRTQHYGQDAQTSVYCSRDPLDFGINTDKHLAGRLPVAAPEIFTYQGRLYIAALNSAIQGIQIAKLGWQPAAP